MIVNFDEHEEGQLIWRYPETNFGKDTEIIVPQGYEALILKDGVCVDCFKAGRYEILKIGSGFFSKLFGLKNKTALCQVYYVNKSMEIKSKWGTPQPVEFRDPETGIPVTLGANGTYKIRIDKPMLVFERLVGQKKSFTSEMAAEYFSDEVRQIVGDILVNVMTDEKKGFYDMARDLRLLSEKMSEQIHDKLEHYGFWLDSFIVAGLIYPDEIKEMLSEYAAKSYRYKMETQQREERSKFKKEERADREYEMNLALAEMCETHGTGCEDDKTVGGIARSAAKREPSEPQSALFCENCGAKNLSFAEFCFDCGKPLQSEKRCGCGTRLAADAKFCSYCGAEADSGTETNDENED